MSRNFFRVLCFLLAVVQWSLAGQAAAQPPKLGVSPPIFQIELGERSLTHSFRLFNYDDEPVEAEIAVHNWELDAEGKTQILPPTETSLDRWIVINPVRLTIPAKGSQVVRFSVRPRVELQPGEHRAMIFVTSNPARDKELSVRFNLRLGMAVYATVGEVSRHGTLHGVQASATELRFDISCEGNAHARLSGQFRVWPAADFPGVDIPGVDIPGAEVTEGTAGAGELETVVPAPILRAGALPSRPVLPASRRFVRVPLAEPLPPGDYVLDLHGALGETEIDRSFSFTVPPSDDSPASPR